MPASRLVQNKNLHPRSEITQPQRTNARAGVHSSLWEWEISTGHYQEHNLSLPEQALVTEQVPATLEALLDRIHPDDQKNVRQAMLSVAHGQINAFDVIHRYRREDGEYRWIATHGDGVRHSDDDAFARIAGSHVDISELKEIELDLILESSHQCSWEWNVQDDSLSLPRSWYKMFGYSEADIGGGLNSMVAFAHPNELARTQKSLVQVLRGDIALYDKQQRVRHKNGHYQHCLVRARVAERDADGRALRLTGTTSDITAVKAALDAL